MRIRINGKIKFFEESSLPQNLLQIIESLGYHPRLVVVEFNGMILNQACWSEQLVKDGDTIEIVTIVGGGS